MGHSRVPEELNLEDERINVTVFRAPGGLAKRFFDDGRLTSILHNEYELVIIWIGSDDIKEDVRVNDVVKDIVAVVESTEVPCSNIIAVVQVEPRIIRA